VLTVQMEGKEIGSGCACALGAQRLCRSCGGTPVRKVSLVRSRVSLHAVLDHGGLTVRHQCGADSHLMHSAYTVAIMALCRRLPKPRPEVVRQGVGQGF
jgi:hypothetical protein